MQQKKYWLFLLYVSLLIISPTLLFIGVYLVSLRISKFVFKSLYSLSH